MDGKKRATKGPGELKHGYRGGTGSVMSVRVSSDLNVKASKPHTEKCSSA